MILSPARRAAIGIIYVLTSLVLTGVFVGSAVLTNEPLVKTVEVHERIVHVPSETSPEVTAAGSTLITFPTPESSRRRDHTEVTVTYDTTWDLPSVSYGEDKLELPHPTLVSTTSKVTACFLDFLCTRPAYDFGRALYSAGFTSSQVVMFTDPGTDQVLAYVPASSAKVDADASGHIRVTMEVDSRQVEVNAFKMGVKIFDNPDMVEA